MNIFLILFFIALFGIAILITRRYFIIKDLEIKHTDDLDLEFEVPELEDIKKTINKKAKKYGYVLIFILVKFYLISGKFLKEKSITLYKIIKKKVFKQKNKPVEPKIENTSSFIKTIKEYKKKVQRIKHKIKQEEGLD